MNTLVRWDPFSEFRSLRHAMDRGLFQFYGPTVWRNGETALTFPVDLSETDGHVVVKAALPGIQPEDVDISVSDGVLTIKGETKSEEKSDGENYHRREIRYGAFSRAIALPAEVDDAKAEAERVGAGDAADLVAIDQHKVPTQLAVQLEQLEQEMNQLDATASALQEAKQNLDKPCPG